jgi:hypothetical protein
MTERVGTRERCRWAVPHCTLRLVKEIDRDICPLGVKYLSKAHLRHRGGLHNDTTL